MENTPHHNDSQPQPDMGYGQYDSGIRSLVKSLQISFYLLVIIILGMLIYFVSFGGYFTVEQQESVLVLRFGKLIARFDDDWHWFFPYPVNTIIRIPTNQQTLVVDFKSAQVNLRPEQAQERALAPGRDKYLLTGDANIVHSSWQIEYEIEVPEKYYTTCLCPEKPADDDELLVGPDGRELGTRGPQTILKNMLSNAVINVTAGRKIEDILYENKQAYKEQVQKLFVNYVTRLDAGITINNVTLLSAEPPTATKKAFSEVTSANQEKSLMIDKANSYKVKVENEVVSEKVAIIASAETYRKKVVSEVKSETVYFEKIFEQYQKNPESVLVALYNFTLADVLTNVKGKYIVSKSDGKRQELRLKINPEPKNIAKK